jgi:O-antigen ligase
LKSASPPPPPRDTTLDRFRQRSERVPLHPLETGVLGVVAVQLVFLPWAIGGMRPWSQIISFGLAVIAFAVALWPRTYADPGPGQAPFRLYTWPKLLRFPVWWLGVALLAYIAVQALNPAWRFTTGPKGWWMTGIPHTTWLPTGVEVPFSRWGPWRMLMIYASVWLSVCAVWIGFTRRRTFQTLATILAGNAFLLAALGIAQRALETDKMFWFWKPPAAYFVSSFVYKNHAGAYFNVLLALCAGLAFWHYERSQRRLDKSSPAGVFAFLGTAVAMIVFFSYSRTATLIMFAFLLITLGVFVWRMVIKRSPEHRSPLMLILLLIGFVAFARIGLVSLRTERFVEKMQEMQTMVAADGLGARAVVTQATFEMARDQPVTGWGSGSYRFLFTIYQQRYPEILSPGGLRLYWEHAHNDYAELFAELGIIGCSLLLLGAGYAGWQILRLGMGRNPLTLFLLLGLGGTLVHCYVDFNFYNPAILTTWGVLLFGAIRWSEIGEQSGGAG